MQIGKACCEGANDGGYVGGSSCRCKWLWHLRLATAWLLGFVGFLRFQEIVDLRACDCTIEGEMLKVYIVLSKNDQPHQGNEVLKARTRSSMCPVAMLEHYMERTDTRSNAQCFLFHAIQNTKNGEVLRQSGKLYLLK